MENNILEIGGSADLIATAIIDFDTPSKTYKQGTVVLDLKNVHAECSYSAINTQVTSKFTELAHSIYKLSRISLSAVPLNSQIYNLFASQVVNNVSIVKKMERAEVFGGNKIMFNELPHSIISCGDIDVEHISIDTLNDIPFIQCDDFDPDKEYDIYYDVITPVRTLSLDNIETNIPYLKLQFHFHGNEDKEDTEGYVLIDKAHIRYSPIVNFTNDSVSYCNLSLTVINSEQSPRLVITDA